MLTPQAGPICGMTDLMEMSMSELWDMRHIRRAKCQTALSGFSGFTPNYCTLLNCLLSGLGGLALNLLRVAELLRVAALPVVVSRRYRANLAARCRTAARC